MKELKNLYNGIMNDYSVRRYTGGWQDIVAKLEKRYKSIPTSDIQFETKLVVEAMNVAKGQLLKDIQCFARELDINIQTLNEKKGTQRSSFGIGS